ncbi:MAG: sterol desaturase family protein [Pseudomonadota bacterium]|nr:sterol desaturase family protein [Pseudomonadota bacterium]
MNSLLEHETAVRLGAFAGVLLAMAAWELWRPRRPRHVRLRRWLANLGIVAVDVAALRLLVPVLAVAMALEAGARGWGLLNVLDTPWWLAVVLSLLLFDLAIYVQHVVFHKVPLLWRLHRMHHTDTDIDVTTGVRFHPLEIVLSMFIKLAVVVLLGTPAVAVLLFEVILNATALFNHSNVGLPESADRWLRWVVVTPDMHRVHHSIHRDETDSNFGFNLPWWDRIFGTYRAQPRDGHLGMTIGLSIFRDRRSLDLHWLLLQPFLNPRQGDRHA